MSQRFPELAGKRCLITGASTGIGAAVALALGREGGNIAVHYNSSREAAESIAREIEAAGGRAIPLSADLSRRGEAARLVSEAGQALGGLDILINNAGGPMARVPFAELADDFVDQVMTVNFTSLVEACRAALPLLKPGKGVIINTTSVAARHGGGPGAIIYAAAKGAVSTFTRGLAKELTGEGIRVNAVSPGVIATPPHERLSPPEVMRGFLSAIPMGRIGAAEDCVGAYLYLASGVMSGYVTGQVLEVNGGQLMP